MAPAFKSRGTGSGKLKVWEDTIVLMNRNGMSLREIAKVVGTEKSGRTICSLLKKLRGECMNCPNPTLLRADGKPLTYCADCATKKLALVVAKQRTPGGWADLKAKCHRLRAKNYNKRFEAVTGLTQQTNIAGPEILERLYKIGSACGLCGVDQGWPWDHVGKESGPELDHILGIGTCIAEHRDDWCRPHNLRLLCVGCHSRDGERRIVDEEILTACIERALAKDRS